MLNSDAANPPTVVRTVHIETGILRIMARRFAALASVSGPASAPAERSIGGAGFFFSGVPSPKHAVENRSSFVENTIICSSRSTSDFWRAELGDTPDALGDNPSSPRGDGARSMTPRAGDE